MPAVSGYGTAQNIRKAQHRNKKIFITVFMANNQFKNKYEVQTHRRLIPVINLYRETLTSTNPSAK